MQRTKGEPRGRQLDFLFSYCPQSPAHPERVAFVSCIACVSVVAQAQVNGEHMEMKLKRCREISFETWHSA